MIDEIRGLDSKPIWNGHNKHRIFHPSPKPQKDLSVAAAVADVVFVLSDNSTWITVGEMISTREKSSPFPNLYECLSIIYKELETPPFYFKLCSSKLDSSFQKLNCRLFAFHPPNAINACMHACPDIIGRKTDREGRRWRSSVALVLGSWVEEAGRMLR